MKLLKLVLSSIHKRGVISTLNYIFQEFLFDFTFRVNTRGTQELQRLTLKGDIRRAVQYQSVNFSLIKLFFNKYAINIRDKVMVDFGSGKGRILIMGMEYKAKKVIGIEFAKELVDISRANIRKYQLTKKVSTQCKIIWDDANNYVISNDESLFFFYNPFDEKIMSKVVNEIKKSNKEILVAYVNPIHKHLFKPTFFEKIDAFGKDEMIVYRNKLK